MPKSRNRIRLDKIEIELTPKEWAIRLVDEIRRHPSELKFLQTIAKGTYRESPYMKPFFALAAQAEDRHPGQRPEDLMARDKLSGNLRGEYQALKSLINNINEELEIKKELSQLKGSALAEQLHQLILGDVFSQTSEATAAWIERHTSVNVGEERKSILEELANVGRAAGSSAVQFSRARDWAGDAAIFLMEAFVRKAAVREVQGKYLDGHAMLTPGTEHALETVIQLVLEAVVTFNGYVNITANGLSEDSRQLGSSRNEVLATVTRAEKAQPWSSLRIDVETIRSRASELMSRAVVSAWETKARDKGIADILQETGDHGSFVWDRFCEKVGVKTLAR